MENYTVVMEYVASFSIQICLFFFVFEMQSVKVLIVSQTPQEHRDGKVSANLQRWMVTVVQCLAFAGMMYFYVDWYIVLEGKESIRERNIFNVWFFFYKVLTFLVELYVLILLCTLIRFFIKVKKQRFIEDYEDWVGFDSQQRLLIGWIITLICLNFANIVFKGFIRSIVQLTHDQNTDEDLDNVIILHKYRFFVFSVIDILNGMSILYAFYCMALSSLKHKQTSPNAASLNAEDEKLLPRDSISCNTIKIKQILAGNESSSQKKDPFVKNQLLKNRQMSSANYSDDDNSADISEDEIRQTQKPVNTLHKLRTNSNHSYLGTDLDDDHSATQFRSFLRMEFALYKGMQQQKYHHLVKTESNDMIMNSHAKSEQSPSSGNNRKKVKKQQLFNTIGSPAFQQNDTSMNNRK
ncbi:hypothetical protein FGO68_gene16385 [Halteria grandinella]|uniref:Uncharacterized protein n=1 Tax=Halteria grandinella TaxID=5974 RepID=A0A8J8NQ53_HALGN|nr:hypothetical protein FGO68_gene16385 [Halteria grandinella]